MMTLSKPGGVWTRSSLRVLQRDRADLQGPPEESGLLGRAPEFSA